MLFVLIFRPLCNSNEETLDLSMKSTATITTSTASASSSSSTTTMASSERKSVSKPQPSSSNSNDRTYAELQTVRSGGRDATQVLRQHQHAASDTQNIPAAAENSSAQNNVEHSNTEPDIELLTSNKSTVSNKKCNLDYYS